MSRALSVRISDRTRAKLAEQARREGIKVHALAVRAVEEAVRTATHPAVRFEDRGEGRRAIVGGWELWEVVAAFLYAQEDLAVAATELAVSPQIVEAAIAYYGEFNEEIDLLLAADLAARDRHARDGQGDFGRGIAVLRNAPGRRCA
ncbi:MAG: hypothetical protein Q7T55_07705 [Solirubrobacteraceae bacterium]|nr:hypothetical protein [Solirubrobacteraceae bacterium]